MLIERAFTARSAINNIANVLHGRNACQLAFVCRKRRSGVTRSYRMATVSQIVTWADFYLISYSCNKNYFISVLAANKSSPIEETGSEKPINVMLTSLAKAKAFGVLS